MPVAYMDGSNMIRVAGSLSELVAGTSAIDTANALQAVEYATNAAGNIVTFPSQYVTGGGVDPQSATYAKGMWDYYASEVQGEQAAITAIGAAGAAAIKWAQGVLFGNPELAGTLAGSGGLLTMSLPAAGAAFAPLLGVSLGGALYDFNPELWTKISQTLMPWAYDDKDTIAFVVDKLGQVFAPKGAVDALKQLFEEEGIGKIGGQVNYDAVNKAPMYYPNNRYSLYVYGDIAFSDKNGVVTTFTGAPAMIWNGYDLSYPSFDAFGTSPFTVTYTNSRGGKGTYSSSPITHSGITYHHTYVPYGPYQNNRISLTPSYPGNIGHDNGWDCAYLIFNGTGWQASYPTGTSAWGGTSVDVSQLTPIQVVSGLDGSTTPYIPVTLPIGDPTITNDPSVQPDPTAPVTAPQLDPFISPVTLPELWPTFPEEVPIIEPGAKVAPQAGTDPLYVPQPDLNPATDPTLVPDAELAKDLPTNKQNPTSGGQSPDPIFPAPGIPFPSWMPAGSDTPVPSGQPGFIQVYHPQPAKFIEFGRWLWVTYADATIDKIWNNPFDGVIGAHELYASPADDGYSTIRCGFLDSGVETQVVRQRYTQINCGSMVIPEYWGNYLDYSPYSQAMLYLPFIGIVPLEVDDIVGHAVNVLYHVDSYTGSCIAQVTVAREGYSNTLYQFSGNCSVEIPLAGASQAQIKAALMTANAYQNAANISANLTGLGGLGSGIATAIGGLLSGGAIASTGNFAGGMASGIGGAASGISQIIHGYTGAKSQQAYGEAQHTANMLSGKAIVQHSGSFGSSHGAMGIKKPYLIIRRPIQKVVNGYQELYGYPAHKQVIIGSCTGYLRCREVHVISSLATDAEKNQIESLLKGGVYVTEE